MDSLEAPGQVELEEVVVVDGIEVCQIRIVAAGAEPIVDRADVAVADGADNRIRDAVSHTIALRSSPTDRSSVPLGSLILTI